MKILSIRLKNLASLAGEHCIDFEAEPLANAGLVAIVGKTGAGKSTILDAMCLALFNKMPRLKGSDGKLTDVDGSELLTNSPLTVLRRGTAHGFAELCFIAQDQKRYVARWEIKRANKNANGKLQSIQRSLKCLTDGVVIADKPKAVEQHIQHITQLSFEQFTRAVLLAQSEVTAFLKARDNERGELLEYLTNSAIFAKIGQLAFEKTKEMTLQRKQIESVLGHIELLSDEELQQLGESFAQEQHKYQQLEEKKQQLQLTHQWFERKQKLEHDIQLKQQQQLEQRKIYDDLGTDQQLLAQLEIFAEIRPQVFQQQQLLKIQQQLEPKLNQQQTLFDALKQNFDQETQQYNQAEQALQQLQTFRQQHHTELKQVAKYVQDRDYIATQYKQTKQKIQQLEEQLQPILIEQQQLAHQAQQLSQQHKNSQFQLEQSNAFSSLDPALHLHLQQLQQFIESYQHIENRIGDIAQAEHTLHQDQSQLDDLTQQFGDLPQLHAKIEQQQRLNEQQRNRQYQFEKLQQQWLDCLGLAQEIENIQIQQQQTFEAETILLAQTKNSEQDYLKAKQASAQLQQFLQQQRLLHSENITQLRDNLQENQPCLVCGSTSHPYRDDTNALSESLHILQQQQENQAIQAEQQQFETWQNLQQQLTQLQAKLAQLTTTLTQQQEKYQHQQTQLTDALHAVDLTLDFNQNINQFNIQLQQQTEQNIQLKQQTEDHLKLLQHAQMQQLKLQKNIQDITQQLHSLQQRKQQLEPILMCLNTDEQQHWNNTRLKTAQQLLVCLQTRMQLLQHDELTSKQIEQNQQQQQLIQATLQHIKQQLTELNHHLTEVEQTGKQNSEHAAQLIQHMTGLIGQKANEWLIAHEQQHQYLQQQYQQIKTTFEQARQHFEQQRNDLEQVKTKLQDTQATLHQIQTEIDAWSVQHSQISPSEFLTLLAVSTQQQQQIRQQLQQVERTLNDIIASLNTLQAQHNEHLHTQPEIDFSALQQHIQTTQTAWQHCSEQRDHYKLKLELHQQNLAKQQQFSEQIQTIQVQEHRWSKISGLLGDKEGKKFRDYAQQYNLDILLEYANQQLALLSQRYTLKRLDNSLSLAIIDHDMDGEIRSVASLSGGESFLTALAISLAIANMASGSMKIESLFIDEGFGTLDASSLHMVMNALDQLQSQGRKVVLISHIQEMHERIPVQIQVQPLGSGSSRIEVVG
ncbi:AAA family ATPase [Acinetobacter sp. MD2]|uniref:AAA family ATPase n=1 Tax=Acinetobacter sp. MD2 TaxID=2600066 RepID=UPI002D1EB3E2|nr:AAA family ATPase [Acinetobacter sp. MD2]MEB3768038.1 AAA family ATPase [Acinetobacter sp. MD2]